MPSPPIDYVLCRGEKNLWTLVYLNDPPNLRRQMAEMSEEEIQKLPRATLVRAYIEQHKRLPTWRERDEMRA